MHVNETLKRFKLSRSQLIGGAIILTSGLIAYAAVPHTFTSGTAISAAQVNANFSDADTRITTLEGVNAGTRITTLETNPSISGNLTLVPSTATAGKIMKGANRFLHNSGINNTFLGVDAGNFTETGQGHNTGIGMNTLQSVTTGDSNVAVGVNALINNGAGTGNVAIGNSSLSANTTGNNNIAIGASAGDLLGTGSNNIYIGSTGGAVDESNIIRIGRGSVNTRIVLDGIRGVTTGVANAINVMIDSNGQLGTVSSSRKVKDDIADMGEASSPLMKLRPVTFHYKADQSPKGRSLQYGLIAEEVEKVAPGLVARNAKGEIETVYYQHLAPMLLNEYQKQQRVIEAQAAALAKQTDRVAALEKQAQEIIALKQELARMAALMARLGKPEKVASAR
jgi:Chaperone of endosialidase